MRYDFTTLIDRHGQDALAVDGLGTGFAPAAPKEGFDAIPMWVATTPTLPPPPACSRPFWSGRSTRCTATLPRRMLIMMPSSAGRASPTGSPAWEPKHIGYENGVLGGVISALNCVCSRGDKVLLHSPTYIGFTRSLGDNGYRIVHSALKQDAQGVWRMDYAEMEQLLAQQKIHAAVLCSPHNPCGRVWERWELEKAMELFRKYDVYVVSDEIWSDLLLDGLQAHPHPVGQRGLLGCAPLPCTPPPRPSTWRVWWAATTSCTTIGLTRMDRELPCPITT